RFSRDWSSDVCSSDLRQRLEQRGWIAYEDYINSRQVTLVRLGDNRYLQSVGVQHFHGFGWPVVLSLIAVTAFVVGLAVYFLLNALDYRLRKLETVATRIARGELDARIEETKLDAIGRLGKVFNSKIGRAHV